MPSHVNLTPPHSHEWPSHGLVALLALATLTNLVVLALALVAAQAAHGADLPPADAGHSAIRSPFQALEEQMAVREWEAQQRAEAESRAWFRSAFGAATFGRADKGSGSTLRRWLYGNLRLTPTLADAWVGDDV